MEYIDILNENGVRTGEMLSRDETHRGGYWHRAVIAAVVNDKNEILMQQRSITKDKFPGLWDLSVAAHIVAGEDAVSALVRELNEEIGVVISKKIQVKDCRFVSSFKNIHHWDDKKLGPVDEHAFYEFFVVNLNIPEKALNFNDGEVQDVKWMSLFEVKKMAKENKLHPRTEWIGEISKYLSV